MTSELKSLYEVALSRRSIGTISDLAVFALEMQTHAKAAEARVEVGRDLRKAAYERIKELEELCLEQHEALESLLNGEEFDVDRAPARNALARFEELKP